MQHFRTLGQTLLGEKYVTQKKRRKERQTSRPELYQDQVKLGLVWLTCKLCLLNQQN